MNTYTLAHSLCYTAWLESWLLVVPALAILLMCRGLAAK